MLPSRWQPRAFSLLEVILALAIFGVAMAVIGQLVRLGLDAAEVSRNDTAAQLFCECKIAEIAAGVELPEPVFDAPLDPNGDWLYTVEAERSEQQSLIALRVTVRPSRAEANSPRAFTLIRWIVDPAIEFEGRDLEAEQAAMEDERIAESKSESGNASTTPADPTQGQGLFPPNPNNGQAGNNNDTNGGNQGGLLPPNLQGPGGGGRGSPGRGDGPRGGGGGRGGDRPGDGGRGGGGRGNGPGNFGPGNFGPGGNGAGNNPGGGNRPNLPNLPNAPQLPGGPFPPGGNFGS